MPVNRDHRDARSARPCVSGTKDFPHFPLTD